MTHADHLEAARILESQIADAICGMLDTMPAESRPEGSVLVRALIGVAMIKLCDDFRMSAEETAAHYQDMTVAAFQGAVPYSPESMREAFSEMLRAN